MISTIVLALGLSCTMSGNQQSGISIDYGPQDVANATSRVVFTSGLLTSVNYYEFATPVGSDLWYQDYTANFAWKRDARTIQVIQTQTSPATTFVHVRRADGAVDSYSACQTW